LKFLVTAGPTREPVDDVRFLSNRSSGKMGYAIARELAMVGSVVLVSGPVELPPPAGVDLVRVETARDMDRAVRQRAPDCRCVVMCAAVADYRPARVRRGKIRKAGPMSLRLVRNPDILARLGAMRRRPALIGFALETGASGPAAARRKLRQKRLDAIVLNYADAMGAERTSGCILAADGASEPFHNTTKSALARRIARLAARLAGTRGN